MDSRLARRIVGRDLTESARLQSRLRDCCLEAIADAAILLAEALAAGNKVMFCGNGGSAADADHFAAELVGRFYRLRRPVPALSLSNSPAVLTALMNDGLGPQLFSRQVEAHGRPGDVLVGITTSGRSANVVRAARAAKRLGLGVVSMTGAFSGLLAPLSDVVIAVPSSLTPRVQEAHGLIGHAICHAVEEMLFA